MIELSPRRNPQSLPAVWCLLIRRACARARPSFWCLLTRCLWTFFHEMGIRGACVRTRAHACGRCIALLRRLLSQSRNFFAALSALCRTPHMGRIGSIPAVWCLLIRCACARARPSFSCLLTWCLWIFFHELGIRCACVRTRAHACGRCIALLRRLLSQSRNFFAALSALCRTPDMGRIGSIKD